MHEALENKRAALRSDFADGRSLLAELDQRRSDVYESLLRVQGALLALDELAAATADTEGDAERAQLRPVADGT